MPKLTRKKIELFGESMSAGAYGLAQFGSLAADNPVFSTDPEVLQALPAYKQGWNAAVVNEQSPAMEDRNALDYILSYNQVYISQMGIPEWIATQTYYKGSVVTDGNQSIYISLVDNNLNNPVTDDIYWARFPTPAELIALENKVDYITPVAGSLRFGPINSMPGYLLCNGQAVSRTGYSRLFSAIGTNFGDGDGNTTFNVPDYRGAFLRGFGGDSASSMYVKQDYQNSDHYHIFGANSGNNNGTFGASNAGVSANMPDITQQSGVRGWNGSGGGGGYSGNVTTYSANMITSVQNEAAAKETTKTTQEVRPVNFAINFFIKY